MSRRKITIDDVRKYVNENSESILISTEYITSKTKLEFRCKCGKAFKQTYQGFMRGKYKSCVSCANIKANDSSKLKLDQLKIIAKELSNSELLDSDYKNNQSKLNFRCSCGEEFKTSWMEFSSRNKRTCNKCSGMDRQDYDSVKKYIESNSNSKLVSKEYKTLHTKLEIECECGEIYLATFREFRDRLKRKCKKCRGGYSNNELFVKEILNKHNIRYKEQFTMEGCVNEKQLPFDFYLPDYNVLIEVDGEQHFRPYRFEDTINNFADRIYNDCIKNSYCEDNNIHLIRIPYYNIKKAEKIIIQEISKYVNTEVS